MATWEELDDGVPESHCINNVSADMVQLFKTGFPDQLDLHKYIEAGWCGHVDTILMGLKVYENEELRKDLPEAQQIAIYAWNRLCLDVWYS